MSKDKNCVFCKIIHREIEVEKVLEGNSFIAFRDEHPKVEGHVLIVPKQHWVTWLDIPNTYGSELLEFSKKVIDKLMDETNADGFNLVMNNLEAAGQIVPHAHLHVLPRKEGDGEIRGNHLTLA